MKDKLTDREGSRRMPAEEGKRWEDGQSAVCRKERQQGNDYSGRGKSPGGGWRGQVDEESWINLKGSEDRTWTS